MPGKTIENNISAGNKRWKILLVEDNRFNQEVAINMLSSQGYVISIANNGAEAIKAISEDAYDIILMDVQMPVMNGYEATIRIREIEEATKTHTHIIGLTANTMIGDRQKCLNAGMDDYITKPVHRNILLNAIERGYGKSKNEPGSGSQEVTEEVTVAISGLMDKLGGNRLHVLQCLEIFKKDSPGLLQSIREGFKSNNRKQSKKSCHGLRGMLLTMEMHKAAAMASTIETLILENDFEKAETLLTSLENEIAAAIRLIEFSTP